MNSTLVFCLNKAIMKDVLKQPFKNFLTKKYIPGYSLKKLRKI